MLLPPKKTVATATTQKSFGICRDQQKTTTETFQSRPIAAEKDFNRRFCWISVPLELSSART